MKNLEFVVFHPFPIPGQKQRCGSLVHARELLSKLISEANKRKNPDIYIQQMELRCEVYAPWHNHYNSVPNKTVCIWSGGFHGAEGLDEQINKFKWEVGLKDE